MAQIITVNEAIDILKDNIRFVRSQANGECIFKCPFCGDSDNPYHGHLYISPEGLINCYKCEMKGTINRVLGILVGSKYKVKIESVTATSTSHSTSVSRTLRKDQTAFEKYISNVSLKPRYVPYFDISNTIETQPVYAVKNDYMNNRIIGNDKYLLPIWYKTNMTQQLCSYYSEYFMEKLIQLRVLDQRNSLVNDYILGRRTSILFLGYFKTLNIFKNDSEEAKYFKVKKNIYYGDTVDRDFFIIINQNKFLNGLTDIYKEEVLNVYFCEGVYDAINLYLRNPKYITGVIPDIVVATGSKVSYPSALYYILDTFMRPIISHNFLDPDIDFKKFIGRYSKLKRVYRSTIAYQNGSYDYGDISKNDLKDIKICWRL